MDKILVAHGFLDQPIFLGKRKRILNIGIDPDIRDSYFFSPI